MPLSDQPMADADFLVLRQEVLKLSARMSCSQALDLADLLHTVIRMRKPHRRLRNLDDLFCGDMAN